MTNQDKKIKCMSCKIKPSAFEGLFCIECFEKSFSEKWPALKKYERCFRRIKK